jgi:hypothetical protein
MSVSLVLRLIVAVRIESFRYGLAENAGLLTAK